MFIGHFGVAFGAKGAAPKTSLGTLFLASQFIDLIWPTLLLTGIERARILPGITRVTPLDFEYYPVSHSLLAAVGWSLLAALVYRAFTKYSRGAVVVGLLVTSHWCLDLLVHRPDLQLAPGSDIRLGLDLWSSLPATLGLELLLFAVGFGLYLRNSAAGDRTGRWGVWGLAAFLVVVYLGSLFGPPPPDVTTLAWVGQSQWLLVIWGYWVDRHRRSTL